MASLHNSSPGEINPQIQLYYEKEYVIEKTNDDAF